MTTTNELTSGSFEGQNLTGDLNFSTNVGGADANLGSTGAMLEGSMPLGSGLNFEAGTGNVQTTTTTTTQKFTTTSGGVGLPMEGLVMGVGGGAGNTAPDVTYSTNT